jgi:signal peptidase I
MVEPRHDPELAREIVDETLEECERLLVAAEAAASDVRRRADEQAAIRAEGVVRALTAWAEERAAAAQQASVEAEATNAEAAQALARAQQLHEAAEVEQRRAAAAVEAAQDEAVALLEEAADQARELVASARQQVTAAERRSAELVTAAEERTERARSELVTLQAELLAELDEEVEAQLAAADRDAAGIREAATDQAQHDAIAIRQAAADQAERDAADIRHVAAEQAEHDAAAIRQTATDQAVRDAISIAQAAADQAESAATAIRQAATDQAAQIVAEAEHAAAQRSLERPAEPSRHDRPPSAPPPTGRTPEQPAVSGPRRRHRSRWARNLRVLALVAATLVAAGVARHYAAQPYTVSADSMEPQLHDGDRVVANKLAYVVGEPARGDIVIFDTDEVPGAGRSPSTRLVKRVIGLPGEVVRAVGDEIYVDGERIDDRWGDGSRTASFGPSRVPEGSVFVLGDNRALSVDSRTFGHVPVDAITGRVEAVVWPPAHAGRV